MSQTDIKNLIDRAIRKDQEAITILYEMTYKKGYSLAIQMVKDEFEVYDIMQESYLVAFNKLETIRDAEKYENWFYTIVANKCRETI